MKTQVKNSSQRFYRKSLTSLYAILTRVEEQTPAKLAHQLHMPKQVIYYHLKRLLASGLLERYGRHNYRPTEQGLQFCRKVKNSSLPVSGKGVRIHNLVVKFPILKDNPDAVWEDSVQLENWVKHYDRPGFPIGITIEHTPRSIIADFHSFKTSKQLFWTEFQDHVTAGRLYLVAYLQKKGIEIDFLHGETLRRHIANEMEELDQKVPPRTTASVTFPRKAEGIFPADFKAQAWMDRSLGHVEIETNCETYEQSLIKIPEMLRQTTQAVAQMTPPILEFSRQIKLHLKVQRQTLKTLKAIEERMKHGRH